jgi:hypothetical protein
LGISQSYAFLCAQEGGELNRGERPRHVSIHTKTTGTQKPKISYTSDRAKFKGATHSKCLNIGKSGGSANALTISLGTEIDGGLSDIIGC